MGVVGLLVVRGVLDDDVSFGDLVLDEEDEVFVVLYLDLDRQGDLFLDLA